MKSIALFAVLGFVAIATAAPAEEGKEKLIPIVRSSFDTPDPAGAYSFSYETGNGIKAEEQGELKEGGEEDEGIASVKGSYSYEADDGSEIEVKYTADENGFRPVGAHIPLPPAIPEGILRALEWIANHPEEDNL